MSPKKRLTWKPKPKPPVPPAKVRIDIVAVDQNTKDRLPGTIISLHGDVGGAQSADASGWTMWEIDADKKGKRVEIQFAKDGYTFAPIVLDPWDGLPRLSPNDYGGLGVPTAPPVPVSDRKGKVRAEGKKLMDDGGAFLALGATLFPMPWAVLNDVERLKSNVHDMLTVGCEFFRVGHVIGSGGSNVQEDSWYDRQHHPIVHGWDVWIDGNRRTLQFAKDAHFRILSSIFLSVDLLSSSDRRRAVEEMGKLFNQFPDQMLGAEISNEAKISTEESHELVSLLRNLCPWLLVSSTAADWGGQSNLVVQHPERKTQGEGGMWEHCEQMYECFKDKPYVGCVQEPIGPHSSVAEDDDPARLTCDAVTGFVCGAPIYVYHCGAGIRFGGEADRGRTPSRHANFLDYPTLPKTWELLRQAKKDFYADVSNIGHITHSNSKNDVVNGGAFPFDTAPLQDLCCGEQEGFLKFYCCSEGVQTGRFAASVMCVSKDLPLTAPTRRMVFTVSELGGHSEKVELEKGHTYTTKARGGFYVCGQFE